MTQFKRWKLTLYEALKVKLKFNKSYHYIVIQELNLNSIFIYHNVLYHHDFKQYRSFTLRVGLV